MEPRPDLVLQARDVIALEARRDVLIEFLGAEAREVEDKELLDIAALSLDVYVSRKDVAGRSITELGKMPEARGVFLRRILRSGLEVPISPETRLERGDIITLIGTEKHVEAAAALAGAAIRPTDVDGLHHARPRHFPWWADRHRGGCGHLVARISRFPPVWAHSWPDFSLAGSGPAGHISRVFRMPRLR